MLFALLGAHAASAAAVLAARRRLGRAAWVVGALGPAAVLAWLAANAGRLADGEAVEARAEWIGGLDLALDLRVDAFAALMLVLVAGIGVLVFAYARSYLGPAPRAARAAALLALFAGAMTGVVVADNVLVLYVAWELTSVTSYLLIGLDDEDAGARAAAQHALLVTALGGLAMLAGLVLLGQQAGTFRLGELVAAPPSGTVTVAALVLVLVGAFTKSAQYPFHSWLPGAMVAPTPVSAYLHAAAMVKAGVYLVARLAPAFADVGVWRPLVVTVGLVTMVAGGLRALRPFDLKQLLAFGTISQLGFLVVLFGIGRPEATVAGCALLLAHGLFKAALFMVVGIVDHETGTRDVRRLPALAGRGWRTVRAVAVVSAASMAAVPPLAGFVAKEEAYGALVDGPGGDRLVLAGIVAGSVLTVAYSLRFVVALLRPGAVAGAAGSRAPAAHAPPGAFVAPAVVLAAATVVLGVAPAVWSGLVDHAAHALDGRAHAHLSLWHGPSVPLLLSAATLAAGAALFAARRPVAALQAATAPPVSGTRVYDAAVRGLLRGAARLTAVVQPGSLPLYAGVILLTAAVATTVALVSGPWWPGWPDAVGRTAHVPVAALLVVGAVASTVARRRFAAVMLLGVVGYAMAVLFVVQGAPDLALTQFGVETLFVVVFLLVLRQLPDRFEHRRTGAGRLVRLAVSAVVGVFVMVAAVAAAGSRTAEPVSRAMSEQAWPEGHGRNVVNVILVDIRGFDTLGEITVLVAAAIGIVALARAGRRPRPRARDRALTGEEVGS